MLILSEQVPLKENLKTSLRRYWFLWLILLLTAFFDFVTTVLFMSYEGIDAEANPVIRWLVTKIGIFPGVFFGKSLQIIAAIGFSALSMSLARAILLLLVLLNVVAIIINLS